MDFMDTEEYVEEYVGDDNVYHYYDDEGSDVDGGSENGGWAPPPPSEASASIVIPATLANRRAEKARDSWKNVHAPKLDASGKQTALWADGLEYVLKMRKNNYVVNGIDCLATAKRLKDCWLLNDGEATIGTGGKTKKNSRKKQTTKLTAIGEGMATMTKSLQEREILADAKRMAEAICYADKMFENPEVWIDAILKRPWDMDNQKVADWEKTWNDDVDGKERKDAANRAEGIILALKKAYVAEQAFEKIEKVHQEILKAARENGFLQKQSKEREQNNDKATTKPKGDDLVVTAATRVQKLWRGFSSRLRLNELTALELAELEAQIAHDKQKFQTRDHKALSNEAKKRAAQKYELLTLEEQKEEKDQENRHLENQRKTKPLLVQLSPGLEVAHLAAGPEMGIVQEYMGVAFELYVEKVWRVLSLLRAEVVRSDPSYTVSDFEHELRNCVSYGKDDRVSRNDLDNLFQSFCPSLSTYERELILTYLDSNMDGLIPVNHVGDSIRGALSDRRHLLCNMVFDMHYFSKSEGVASLSGRLQKLTEFYRQFAPNELKAGKPLQVHRKYKDTESVNKELFQKLYRKYAPWLDAPEYLWSLKAQRREQERLCLVETRSVITLYSQYVARHGSKLSRGTCATIERAVSSLRAAVSNSKMRRADWLAFHAELCAGIVDDGVFEQVVCEACDVPKSKWTKFAEEKARRELVRKNRTSWFGSIAAAEVEKMKKLEETLSAANFKQYKEDLHDVLRKVSSSMLKVSGASRSLEELEREFESSPSFGDDRKLNKRDFKAGLARYGIILSREEIGLLSTHFDHNNSGYVSVDGFICGIREQERSRDVAGRKAAEVKSSHDSQKRKKRWVKAMASTILPENKKVWIRYVDKSGPRERPYWYCKITGERTWKKPKRFERSDKKEWTLEMRKRFKQSLKLLERFREEANTELDIQIDVIRRSIRSVLPVVGAEVEGIPSTVMSSHHLRGLTSLILDRNNLKEIPPCIMDLRSLRRLSLVGNEITHIPGDDFRSTDSCYGSLRSLHLSHNKLQTVPKTLCDLHCLRELELDGNQITHIPEQALNGLELEALNLSNNRLRTLPVGDMLWGTLGSCLKWLDLSNNQLTTVPRSFGERLQSVKFLDLKDNRLETLPDSFGCGFRSLETLMLQGNNLLELPEGIKNAVALRTLYLQHNALSKVPDQLCCLNKLETIYLNNNRLTCLPDRVGDLASLENLYLQCNRLTTIPVTFGHLEALRLCWMHQNEMEHMPTTMPLGLQQWKLHNNRLKEIPGSIGDLVNLTHLDLAGNHIVSVPASLYNLKKLESLRLDHNPLEKTLAKIVETGHYSTPDEQNYGLLIRKLVDSLKDPVDVQGRIDMALGISVAEAMRQAKLEAQEKLQKAKEVALSATITEKQKKKMLEEKDNVIRKGGLSPAQQSLSLSLERFSKAEGRDGETISQASFRRCITVIGALLTDLDVERMTIRVFHMYDSDETGVLTIASFVNSIQTAIRNSGVHASGTRDVASAVLRYCSAQRVKLAFSTLDRLNSAISGNKETAAAAATTTTSEGEKKQKQNTAQKEMQELRILNDRNEELDREVAQLKRELDMTKEKAKVVQECERRRPATASPHRRRRRAYSSEISSEKVELRAQLREKNRKIQEMKRAINQTQPMARHYNDRLATEYRELKAKDAQKRKRQENQMAMKNMSEIEREHVFSRREKRGKIAAIFHAHAKKPVGGYKAMLGRGEMIAAAGDFYRQFGRGRFGLEPSQWREKLLRTVNQAFSSGFHNPKTGRFQNYDKDENGLLDLHEFQAFCAELERRILELQHHDEEHDDDDHRVETQDKQQRQGQGQSTKGSTTIWVDFVAAIDKVIPIEMRSSMETVANLKAKIAFCEAIPKEDQLLMFQGKKLHDAASLQSSGLRDGSRVKLVLYPNK